MFDLDTELMTRKYFRSGVPWEEQVAYSRAIKDGNRIYISGTTATDKDGTLLGKGDAYIQAKQCILNIQQALQHFGFDLEQVIRTRMFVTDISRWQEFGKAHREFFSDINPVTTMVEINQLIHPEMLIEIEAEASTTK